MVSQAEEHLSSLNQHNTPEIDVTNPVTGEIIGTIPNFSREDVAETVARARAVQPAWAATPVRERSQILLRFADLLSAQQEQVIEVIRQETGKAYGSAYGELTVLAILAEYYARHAEAWLKPERQKSLFPVLYSAKMVRKPIGVVGNISPWNFPFNLAFIDMLPALVAGNAVVIKPSEITPFAAFEGLRLLEEAGLPKDVLQIVTGYGSPTGEALVDHVDYIMFTGSTAVGKKIAVQAATRLIPFCLELGGNNAMIVLKDADVDKAAACAVRSGLENAGQMCITNSRILVEAPIYEPFVAAMEKWRKKVKVGFGAPGDFKVHMGSLTNRREFDRAQAHIQDAVKNGARVVGGGNPLTALGPLFFEPTIVADATPDMDVMKYETFAPVIAVTRFETIDEAVALANGTDYGLTASVWSGDAQHAEQVATRLDTGDVSINSAMLGIATPTVAFGGQRNSGFGRRNGKQGLMKYTTTQSIVTENILSRPEPTMYTQQVRISFSLIRRLSKFIPFFRH